MIIEIKHSQIDLTNNCHKSIIVWCLFKKGGFDVISTFFIKEIEVLFFLDQAADVEEVVVVDAAPEVFELP